MALTLNEGIDQHLLAVRVAGYSEYTVRTRQIHLRLFLQWCIKQRLCNANEITAECLQRYRRFVFEYRMRDGEPLALSSQHARLVPIRVWFRWMHRSGIVIENPGEYL